MRLCAKNKNLPKIIESTCSNFQNLRLVLDTTEFTHFCPLAEVRLLKPGIQRRRLAKDAPLPFRFASRFFNRFPVALPLRFQHASDS